MQKSWIWRATFFLINSLRFATFVKNTIMSKSERICQCCGKSFLAENREINRGNAKYCSQSCAGKMSKELEYTHICKHCGREFTSTSKNSKYCSTICKQKNYRARQKSLLAEKSIKYYYNFFENIPCEICGWDKSVRDLHHITEVANGGSTELTNLISVCPNCHRMIHRNLISKEQLVQIVKSRTISSSSIEESDALAGN